MEIFRDNTLARRQTVVAVPAALRGFAFRLPVLERAGKPDALHTLRAKSPQPPGRCGYYITECRLGPQGVRNLSYVCLSEEI
jgi:hypothetical protein